MMRVRHAAWALAICALLDSGVFASDMESIKRHVRQSYEKAYRAHDIAISQITIHYPESAQVPISCQPPNVCSSLSPAALAKGSGTFIAKIRQGTGMLSVPVSYSIQAEIAILRAKSIINTNASIDTQNTQITRTELSMVKSSSLLRLLAPNMLGKVSARSIINPNTIITEDKVKERILVQKGDIITGILKEQNLQIQTQVQALQHGMKNEIIKVRNITTQKILRARVVDEKTAEIF